MLLQWAFIVASFWVGKTGRDCALAFAHGCVQAPQHLPRVRNTSLRLDHVRLHEERVIERPS